MYGLQKWEIKRGIHRLEPHLLSLLSMCNHFSDTRQDSTLGMRQFEDLIGREISLL